ncbi:hypothetical protein BH10PSE17_BH10PSE17_31350 [soil metagenome]
MNVIEKLLVRTLACGAAVCLLVFVITHAGAHAGPAEVSAVDPAAAAWPAPDIVPANALAEFSADNLFLSY